jgi:glutathione S-transferase
MLKLYDYPDCPFCQKVRVVLAEKDLEYEKVFVDLRKQEQKTAEFLHMNPYGKVPVLVDEDEVIYDSTIINEYLDDEYPLPRLMPEDSGSGARPPARGLHDNSFIPPTTMLLAQLGSRGRAGHPARRAGTRRATPLPLLPRQNRNSGNEHLVGTSSPSPTRRSRPA